MSEDFLSKIMSQFGGTTKEYVYLSVTPGVGLEMCQLDVTTNPKSVKSYAVRDLAYNETSKDIADYDTFKNAVSVFELRFILSVEYSLTPAITS